MLKTKGWEKWIQSHDSIFWNFIVQKYSVKETARFFFVVVDHAGLMQTHTNGSRWRKPLCDLICPVSLMFWGFTCRTSDPNSKKWQLGYESWVRAIGLVPVILKMLCLSFRLEGGTFSRSQPLHLKMSWWLRTFTDKSYNSYQKQFKSLLTLPRCFEETTDLWFECRLQICANLANSSTYSLHPPLWPQNYSGSKRGRTHQMDTTIHHYLLLFCFSLKPLPPCSWICDQKLHLMKCNDCQYIWWILDSPLPFLRVQFNWKCNINHRRRVLILPLPPKKTSRLFCPQLLDWNAADTLWFL